MVLVSSSSLDSYSACCWLLVWPSVFVASVQSVEFKDECDTNFYKFEISKFFVIVVHREKNFKDYLKYVSETKAFEESRIVIHDHHLLDVSPTKDKKAIINYTLATGEKKELVCLESYSSVLNIIEHLNKICNLTLIHYSDGTNIIVNHEA